MVGREWGGVEEKKRPRAGARGGGGVLAPTSQEGGKKKKNPPPPPPPQNKQTTKKMALAINDAVQVRFRMIAPTTPEEHTEAVDSYLDLTCALLRDAAAHAVNSAPPDIDIGRTIAFLDTLLEAKAILANAVDIGANVKRRRVEASSQVTVAAVVAAEKAQEERTK